MTTRTEKQIQNMESDAQAWITIGKTDVPGMTYEEGVSYALRWVLGEDNESPIETMADAAEDDDELDENGQRT